MQRPTKTQAGILKRLEQRWEELGTQPNLSELANELGMSYVSFKQHLDALARKGELTCETKGAGKPPLLTLGRQESKGVPLVGEIAAGSLHGEVEHLEGYLEVPGDPERFALRVKGDSMADFIAEGDVVIFSKAPPRSGDICAVRYEDETTLKYLDLYPDGSALLRSHNPAYTPIDVKLSEIYVAGRFDSLMRGTIARLLFRELP